MVVRNGLAYCRVYMRFIEYAAAQAESPSIAPDYSGPRHINPVGAFAAPAAPDAAAPAIFTSADVAVSG